MNELKKQVLFQALPEWREAGLENQGEARNSKRKKMLQGVLFIADRKKTLP